MLKRVGQSLVPFARAGLTQSAESFRGVSSQFFDAPNGPSVKQVPIEDEWYNRQRNIFPLLDKEPYYPVDVFVAPNAVVCGDVDIYGGASVFFGAVLRGDLNKIRLGNRSAILDRAVVHAARAVPTGLNAATLIGEKVTVEPYAVLRSCRVEPKVIIGARSVVCEGAILESESILAPNSVVPPARRIPSGELWGGSPAKFIRKLTDHERDRVLDDVSTHYYNLAAMFRREALEPGSAWRDVEAWRQKLVDQGEYEWINFREQKYLMRLQHEAEALEKLTL
ncbi:hypothetical protein HYH02_009511 [Chlamydomonas schloesseri]|uniref:Uncharacterized protein n=1 Tax=Chlamydomonas schloesseri TaxID=2026947 RepID=A0A835W766_9CHLO|nr:hypothetical protein HYH02_009511 [Chlamydomonas schloesseri]|eukprot:KAG2443097.1 hypothetical protein HYH02_009511 [Chlamydomonas schloesseri]